MLSSVLEIFYGLVIFKAVFYFFQSLLKRNCKELSLNIIFDISNKATSSLFAICSCLMGWFVNRQCYGNFMRIQVDIIDSYLNFGVAYFIYDLMSMYLVHNTLTKDWVSVSRTEVANFLRERSLIVCHHIIVPVLVFLVSYRNGLGDCLIGTVLLMEASTPFVSARVVLVHFDMKGSKLYFVNGMAMLVTFFLCRVMLLPSLYLWYSASTGLGLLSSILAMPTHCHIATISLWLPQLVWFNKMVKGSIKLLSEKEKR